MKVVVCPFSKPDCTTRLVGNWQRQRATGWQLVIIENRSGQFCGGAGPWVVATSHTRGAGRARNLGIQIALEMGADVVAQWDSDDWYGPDYLLETEEALSRRALVGKRRHYCDYGSRVVLYEPRWQPGPSDRLMGGTLAFWVDLVRGDPAPFSDERLDDLVFVEKMKNQAEPWATTVGGYVYNRTRSDHVAPAHTIDLELKLYGRRGFRLFEPDEGYAAACREAEHGDILVHPE